MLSDQASMPGVDLERANEFEMLTDSARLVLIVRDGDFNGEAEGCRLDDVAPPLLILLAGQLAEFGDDADDTPRGFEMHGENSHEKHVSDRGVKQQGSDGSEGAKQFVSVQRFNLR